MKSVASGRKGPGILQPWKNVWVLLRKGSVFSKTTSYIFQIAPIVYISSIICAILMMPFPGFPSIFGFEADFVMFAYLLGVGKFFFIISAMDTGSSFEGMGANREALYSMLVEPAFFILVGTLTLFTGHSSMYEVFQNFLINNSYCYIISAIIFYLIIQIAMIENSRMPVDDPKTHLELTMVHEVMILDHSGFDLAIIHIGTYLKFAIYGTFIANCIIPSNLFLPYQIAIYFSIQIFFAAIIGILESFRARKKMMKNPQYIITLSSIAMIAFVLCLLLINKMI